MKSFAALFAVCAALLLAACASNSDKTTRYDLRGFSFTAPPASKDEKPWGVVKRAPDVLILGKPGVYESEIFTIQAMVIKLPVFASADALLQHIKAAQQRELDPNRFRILRHDLSLQSVESEPCGLSHIEAVDRAIPATTGPTANMMLETLTLTCPHPRDRSTGINVTYLYQYFPEDRDPRFLERGNSILGGLRLDGQP